MTAPIRVAVDEERVRDVIATIDDPEYPGVSIVDLGLLEEIEIAGSHVHVGLVPTFSGCPALDVIREDVVQAVTSIDGVSQVDVRFLAAPVWTPARISEDARSALGDRFTVAVEIQGRRVTCPRCGGATSAVAAFGPTRCHHSSDHVRR